MKLLIVDDELHIRTGIQQGIEWSAIGINEVMIAADGIEALETFRTILPEIVITDIRMPGMDGLELSKRLKEISPTVQIIILSGYSEFEYAKKALQIGVVDYELKPVKIKNLISLVAKAKEEIQKIIKDKEEINEYKKIYKEKFIEDIIQGNITDKSIIIKGLYEYFRFEAKGNLLCFLMSLDNNNSLMSSSILQMDAKTLVSDIDKIVCEWLENKNGVILRKTESLIFTIIRIQSTSSFYHSFKQMLQEISEEVNKKLESKYKLSCSIGVSNSGDVLGIRQMYYQTLQALNHRLYAGVKAIIYFNEVNTTKEIDFYRHVDEKELNENIANYDHVAVFELINNEFKNLKDQKCIRHDVVRNMCIDLKNILIRTVKENCIDFEGLFGNNLKYFNEIPIFDTIDDYKKWVLDAYYLVLEGLSDLKGNKHSLLMHKAAEFIKKNYQNEITVETLSEYVQKTPNYFSHLFKKEFDMSFSEFLNKVRINEAKKLMRTTTLLAYEISEKVGYQDYKYFTQVFKKVEGYAPSEYRKGKNWIKSD